VWNSVFFGHGVYLFIEHDLLYEDRFRNKLQNGIIFKAWKIQNMHCVRNLIGLVCWHVMIIMSLLSPYPDHLLPHLSKLQTAFGINSLTLSVSLIHILVFHLLTTLHKSDPHCHHHLCHHQSLLLFFTLDLKHTSSSSLFHLRLHHRYSLDWSHGLLAGPFFFCWSVLF